MNESFYTLNELGEGLTDAHVHEIHVSENQQCKQGQALISVETAKSIVELPCPYDCTIDTIMIKQNDKIKLGQKLIKITSHKNIKNNSQIIRDTNSSVINIPDTPIHYEDNTSQGNHPTC